MSIKDFVNNLHTKDYYYIVKPENKLCIEIDDAEKAQVYSKTFGSIMYDHYPYEECGFEDPYTFAEEWEVLVDYGDRITYEVDENNLVREVLVSHAF